MDYEMLFRQIAGANGERLRDVVIRVLDKERVECIQRAAREEAIAADANGLRGEQVRNQHAVVAQTTRSLAAHYQQAIDVLRAAPLPPAEPHDPRVAVYEPMPPNPNHDPDGSARATWEAKRVKRGGKR